MCGTHAKYYLAGIKYADRLVSRSLVMINLD